MSFRDGVRGAQKPETPLKQECLGYWRAGNRRLTAVLSTELYSLDHNCTSKSDPDRHRHYSVKAKDMRWNSICFSTALMLFSYSPSFVGSAFGQTGAIRGTVIDETDRPIQLARVRAFALSGPPQNSAANIVETDQGGHFAFESLPWGRYGLVAMKEDAGYPNTYWQFYGNGNFQMVALTSKISVVDVQIKLGPKAGVLTGEVTDAETGEALKAAFKLVRAATPHLWLSTSQPTHYHVLLPPSVEVLVEVSAPGYQTWFYGGPSDTSHRIPLYLVPGEERTFNIQLQPERNRPISRFLIPSGYTGWVKIHYNVKDAPEVQTQGLTQVFRLPESGILRTSSAGPHPEAQHQYFYYSEDGSLQRIQDDYRDQRSMIWGDHTVSTGGAINEFDFFVGSEEQYKKHLRQ